MNIQRLTVIDEQRCKSTGEMPLQIYENDILGFAERQFFHNQDRHRWNGRQIRNAFQIASSLAYFDADKYNQQPATTPVQPKLAVKHFEMIHEITLGFDEYMIETVGKTDGEMAFERDDRADHWTPRRPAENGQQQQQQYYNNHSHGSPTPRNSGSNGWGHAGSNGNRQSGSWGQQASRSSTRKAESFDESDSLNRSPYSPPAHSQAPTAQSQRPPLWALPSFSSAGSASYGDREYGPPQGGGGYSSSRHLEFTSADFSNGSPHGPSGSRDCTERSDRPDFGPHVNASPGSNGANYRGGYATTQTEWSNMGNKVEE